MMKTIVVGIIAGLSLLVAGTVPRCRAANTGVPLPLTAEVISVLKSNYVDRDKLNATIFKALKSNGVYGVVDNSGPTGSDAKDVKTLHRIDPNFEIAEIEKAGFKLVATSDVLSNSNDPHTEPVSKMNHMEDRFVLKFVKP